MNEGVARISKPKRRFHQEHDDLYQMPNDTWYLRYWSPKLGRTLEVSLKTPVLAKALKERKRRLEALDEEKDADAVGYRTFKVLAEAFMKQHVWNRKATELSARNQIYNHLIPEFGHYSPDRIDNNLWRRYALERRAENPKANLHNARKYLVKITNWAFNKRITKLKISFDHFDKGRKSPGVEISEADFMAIRKHLNRDWQDLSAFAFGMGMRVMEIKKMRWEWINPKTRELNIPPENAKTDNARSPVIPDHLWAILNARRTFIASDWVFPGRDASEHFSTSDHFWQEAKQKAGVKCRFHDLRHTWLSRAFRTSNRYAEICAYAGLSLKEAIQKYVHFTVADMGQIAKLSPQIGASTGENWGESA